jgi:hypothetical protein
MDCPSNQSCDTKTQKVDHIVIVSIVCDITSLISPTSLNFSSRLLVSGFFYLLFHTVSAMQIEFFAIFWGPRYRQSHQTEVYQPMDKCALCPKLT